MALQFGVLGPLEVCSGTQRVDVSGAKRRALLAYMLVHAGAPQPLDRIIDAIWDGNGSVGSRATVQTYFSQFRKLFASVSDGPRVDHRAGGYVLDLHVDALDASRFEALVGAASAETDRVARLSFFDDALALWRGAPLDEFGGCSWADERARQWTRMRVLAHQLQIDVLLELGRHRDALPMLEHLVGVYPLQEPFWAQLALAHYRSGQQADALAACREVRRVLAQELGIDPGSELVELETKVLRQDPTLDLPSSDSASSDRPARFTIMDALPVGVVTFLLTDVVSSSQLWDLHPEEMARALMRQENLIEEVVQSHGGRLLKSRGEGDATVSVFAQASDALVAAVMLQRRLQSEPWPTNTMLSTRTVLHTGEAQLREGDYFGGTLNRAARIRGLAAGGEILLSRATHDLVVDALPDGISLVESGTHAMRGLRRQETVFAVNAAAASASSRRRATARADLVGRADVMDRVLEALGTPGVVTITGTGGIGKTRLMLEVCDLVRSETSGMQVWIVELAGAGGAVAIESALREVMTREAAPAVGPAREIPRDDLPTVIASVIGSGRGLLALDNCEHLVGSLRNVVNSLVAACPGLSVLATSRQSLGVAAERVVPLAPLDVPSVEDTHDLTRLAEVGSVRLVMDRLRDAGCDLQLTPATAVPLAQLCRLLDGIPLALELASARLRVTSPHDLVYRMSRQLDLLQTTTGDPRHRTLYGAIDWSYQLLDGTEQRLLRRLAVFVGGFTLDAAEAVCVDDEPGTLASPDAVYLHLAELVSKSLVVFERERARYRLLEPVRVFAREQCAQADETAAVARHHADWVMQRARVAALPGLRGEPGVDESFRAELDNLHAALAWLHDAGDHENYLRIVAMLGYTLLQCDWRRGREAAEIAVSLAGGARPRLRAGVLLSRGMIEQRVMYHNSVAWLMDARAIYAEIGDRSGLAWSTYFLARARFFQDDAAVDALSHEALLLFRELGQPFGEMWSLINLGVQAGLRGSLDAADAYLYEALAIVTEVGQDSLHGMILGELGGNALARGDLDRARALLREGIELQALASEDSNTFGVSSARAGHFTDAAWVELEAGALDDANALISESLREGLVLDDEWHLCEALLVAAAIALEEGRPSDARRVVAATGWDVESPGDYIWTLPRSIFVLAFGRLTPILEHHQDEAREGRRRGLRTTARTLVSSATSTPEYTQLAAPHRRTAAPDQRSTNDD
jgi:predicted ATPase/DNA-binding SARP family transcriptional activator